MEKVKSYPKEVQEIHHAFETAGDKILAEAQTILKDCETKTIHKGKRLLSLGFKQSKEAIIADGVIGKEATAKETADLVISYKVKYPNNKFITEKQVEAICEKWNLVCAPVDRYKGFVPENKVIEIERFKFNSNDKRQPLIKILSAWNTDTWLLDFMFGFTGGIALHNRIGLRLIPANHPKLYWQGSNLFGAYNDNGELAYVEKYEVTEFKQKLICAPKKDMDLRGLKKIGSIFSSFTTVVVPDPVVLQPCNGGYLIITAWGDEATDENVVNQGMN